MSISSAAWHGVRILFVGLSVLVVAPSARADGEGQADLDRATEAKLTAESLDDLADVIRLCRKSLQAGLDDPNTTFARGMLAGTLTQRAEIICAEIFDRPSPPQRWPELRRLAMADLEESLKLESNQPDSQYMVGRLQALPGGDRKRAMAALDEAVRLTKDEPMQRARALLIRGNLTSEAEKRMADYNEAVELAPRNSEVIRTRGLFQLMQNKYEEAVADLDKALQLDPKSAETYEALGVAQFMQKDFDNALKSFDKAVELAPDSPLAYTHRARIYSLQGDNKKALAELSHALKLEPRSLVVLLLRARVHQQAGDVEKALDDVDEVLRLRPGLAEALQMHAVLAAGSGRYDQAINDLEELKNLAPNNTELLLQLGMFYTADKQPKKAVDTFTQVLADDAKNWLAHRARADAYLNLGKQNEALDDYEAALQIEPDNSGILNNLAWILATSPDEKLRDGKRAIELATQACKLTDFKEAHILSTLAASYAESGDFDKAVSWSEKAVAIGKPPMKEQLAKELESYQAKKPWREALPPEAGGAAAEASPDDSASLPGEPGSLESVDE